MNYKLECVQDWQAKRLEQYFPFIFEQFERLAIRFPSDFCLEIIVNSLAKGERKLWLIFNKNNKPMAILTTITDYCQMGKLRLRIMELAGVGGLSLTYLMPVLEQYAKKSEIKTIIAYGRKGWQKALKKHGFKDELITYKKEI